MTPIAVGCSTFFLKYVSPTFQASSLSDHHRWHPLHDNHCKMPPIFDTHVVNPNSDLPWSDTRAQSPEERHFVQWVTKATLFNDFIQLQRTDVNWSGVTMLLKVNALNNFTIFLPTLASSLSSNITMAWNENTMDNLDQASKGTLLLRRNENVPHK